MRLRLRRCLNSRKKSRISERLSYLNSPFACGVCGKKLPPNSLACSECGADEKTGLRDDTWETDASSELGLADEENFDYDHFLEEEFGVDAGGRKMRFLHPVWWAAGVVLLLAILFYSL